MNRIRPRRCRRTGSASLPPKASRGRFSDARGIPFTAVRYFNTFGPGQTYTPYVGVITIFVTRLLRGEAPVIFGDGEQQRDFVHVDDIAAGTMAAPGRAPGTYNLGTGRGTSLNELAGCSCSGFARDGCAATCAGAAGRTAILGRRHQRRPPGAGLRSDTNSPGGPRRGHRRRPRPCHLIRRRSSERPDDPERQTDGLHVWIPILAHASGVRQVDPSRTDLDPPPPHR